MTPTISKQPTFECERSCGKLIEPGDICYITGPQVICGACHLNDAERPMELTPERQDRVLNAHRAAVRRDYGDSLT